MRLSRPSAITSVKVPPISKATRISVLRSFCISRRHSELPLPDQGEGWGDGEAMTSRTIVDRTSSFLLRKLACGGARGVVPLPRPPPRPGGGTEELSPCPQGRESE